MKFLLFTLIANLQVFADSEIVSKILLEEYRHLRSIAKQLEESGDWKQPHYFKEKLYGDHYFLWAISDDPNESETIRIYKPETDQEPGFSATYHKNTIIVRGRMVLRRFYGPTPHGWRNDTIDYNTWQYLGRQGTSKPRLTNRDQEIMQKWKINEF